MCGSWIGATRRDATRRSLGRLSGRLTGRKRRRSRGTINHFENRSFLYFPFLSFSPSFPSFIHRNRCFVQLGKLDRFRLNTAAVDRQCVSSSRMWIFYGINSFFSLDIVSYRVDKFFDKADFLQGIHRWRFDSMSSVHKITACYDS